MSDPGPLFIRADADVRTGTGHVMRCLALAQAWTERGGVARLLMARTTPAVRQRVLAEGFEALDLDAEPGSVSDARAAARIAAGTGARWLAIDGYHFDAAYQRAVKDGGLGLLAVDDYGQAEHYAADIVLNTNAYVDASLYAARAPGTRLLLGAAYALIRREFWPWRGRRRTTSGLRRVLVTLGGADPDNATLTAVRGLALVGGPRLAITVIVGGSVPPANVVALENAAGDHPHAVSLVRNMTTMPALMAGADLAVAAGGSTTWERALMGLPSIAVILAENQAPTAAWLDRAGLGRNLGWHDALTPEAVAAAVEELRPATVRAAMAERGQALIDGYGAARVVAAMIDGR